MGLSEFWWAWVGTCWEKGPAPMGTSRGLLREHIRSRERRLLGVGLEVKPGRGGAVGQRACLEWGARDWRERQFLMVPSPGAGFPLVLPSQ